MKVEVTDDDTDKNTKDDGKSIKLSNSANSALKNIETRQKIGKE